VLLKKDIKEQADYHILSQELFKLFLDSYGILKENPQNQTAIDHTIERRAIEIDESGATIVEVNLRPVKVFLLPNYKYLKLQKPIFVQCSRVCTLKDLKRKILCSLNALIYKKTFDKAIISLVQIWKARDSKIKRILKTDSLYQES